MLLRRIICHLCLALMIALGQGMAAVHEASHWADDLAHVQDKSSPHSGVCEKCLAFAHLGHGVNPHVFGLSPEREPARATARVAWLDVDSPRARTYLSRAPPAFS